MSNTKDPEALSEVNAAKINDDIRQFVSELSMAVTEAKTERAFWETAVDRYTALRYGWRDKKVKPWPGCANYSMPLVDTDIARTKPSYVNLVNVSPIVSFEAANPQYIEAARKREWLFDWRMRTRVKYFKPYVVGVDYLLSQGATIFKTTWNFSTRTYYKQINLAELPTEVLNALYDPRMDDAYLSKIMVEEFQINQDFDENVAEVARVVKEFRAGKSEFELKLVEAENDQPELTACNIREDVVFPVDTTDLNEARFIDYIFTKSMNEIKIGMKDGRYTKYSDNEIESWMGSVPQSKNRSRRPVNTNKKDTLIWLHETCVWYDIDGDGYEERCIVTWPDGKPDQVLRFIENPYDHGQWPYDLIKREYNGPGAFDSRGYGALGEDFQNAISTFVNQSVDNGTITNNPRLKYRRGTLANPKNIRFVPGESIEILGNIDDVKIEQTGNSSQGFLFQSAQYFKSWADQRTGNLSSGLTSPNNSPGQGSQGMKTAKEVGLIEQLQSETQSLDLQVFQDQMANVYFKIDALYEQFGPEEEEVLITGEKPVKISRSEIQCKCNIVPNGKLDNSNPALRAAKAFRLMQVFLNDPMINQRELKELYLAENDVRLTKVLLKTPEQLQQEQQAALVAQEKAKAEALQTQMGLRVFSDNMDVRKEHLMPKDMKAPAESIGFKDLPVSGKFQMALQAGLMLDKAELEQQEKDNQKVEMAKAKKPVGAGAK